MKIKKYTIDQEIPKGATLMPIEPVMEQTKVGEWEDGEGIYEKRLHFYFLVEEENVPRMRETNTIKCPKCSHTIIIY